VWILLLLRGPVGWRLSQLLGLLLLLVGPGAMHGLVEAKVFVPLEHQQQVQQLQQEEGA
jgi:hypothetical protein